MKLENCEALGKVLFQLQHHYHVDQDLMGGFYQVKSSVWVVHGLLVDDAEF